jgi:DNA-binding transcriptional regulator YiaG
VEITTTTATQIGVPDARGASLLEANARWGRLEPGDVAALRRFICLTQEQFAQALGISVHTLRNWEQDRVTPDGPGPALLRIAARHPRIVRENVDSVA